MEQINIGQKDVLWNYLATFLQIGVGVILMPLILRNFPQETIAIWTIFTTIISLSSLLDFGFNPSFTRNVSYVVSGVKELKASGYSIVESGNSEIDYNLFKGLINTMKWFYSRMAWIFLFLLITVGTYYIHFVLQKYTENKHEVHIAWIILCLINSYNLYTLYYDSLMQGMGYIKLAKQIQIIGQSLYLTVAIVLILLHYNLIAIVSAQAISIIIRRTLSYRSIYTKKFKQHIQNAKEQSQKQIIKSIYPNAVKIGLTSLGGFLVTRSAIIIGSLYLTLEDMASYGITMQIFVIISSISFVYITTYQPKIAQYRIHNNNIAIKKIYLCNCFIILLIFIVSGAGLLLWGDEMLTIIKSKTLLLPRPFIFGILVINLLEINHSTAGSILLSKNEVPFFKASILSGIGTLVLLIIFFRWTELGIWSIILAQGLVSVIYNNWKWPYEAYKSVINTKA